MAAVVTMAGSLTCAHTGKPTLSSTAKLTAGGNKVILFSDLTTFKPYTGCTYMKGQVNTPCASTSVDSGGQAGKLTAGGKPVLLDDLMAHTDNGPTPGSVTVSGGQSKLTAA